MYKISQFSKISGLTVKTLRYYDESNILKPSFRNEENQYRYYNDSDLIKAMLIKKLRTLGFSIMEIREVIETVENENDLVYILQEKKKLIERNISKEKELIEKISSNTFSFETTHKINDYPIEKKEIQKILVASIRFTGKYSDLDKYVPILYKTVKNNKDGKHFNCYFDEECVENADIELCIPIKEYIVDAKIECKILPKIKALHTIHYGGYDTLYLAYRAVFNYANTHHIEILTPIREMYIKSPGMIFQGNPDNYITEILLPYEIEGKE
ncbi:MerR family transcriptional regulator [Candidatus Stoquefichus massiliensis]|uniref:MerR family transcriptional regulator n=1 Tax=Candidatus Stoquefichus massiliensis TaxID=1470350 RepID=UPI00047F5EEE|nr:MerR family transcriptional regulator [Candidatus Stoquefichus massiliensis]